MNKALSIVSTAALALALAVAWAPSARADEPAPASPPPAAEPAPISTPAPAPAASNENWTEPGRFGLMGAITDDGFQFGFVRADEHFEIALTADSSFASSNSTAMSGGLGDLGATGRLGPRFRLGHLNYLSFGGQYHQAFFGKDNGVSTEGSFATGPYVGLQRNFAGTPLMITLWVLPYQFRHELSNDGTGKQVVLNNNEFFQGGGFGLAYLF